MLKKFPKNAIPIFLTIISFNCITLYAQVRPNISNILVSKADGIILKNFYSDRFRQSSVDRLTLPDSFQVDLCFIEKLTALLESTSKNYDGFKIIFGTDAADNNKETMFIAPTSELIEGGKTYHAVQWDDIPGADNCGFKNYSVIGINAAQEQVKKFAEFHRGDNTANPRDSLSKSVWFNRSVMQFLRDTILNCPDAKLFKAINIFNVSYTNFINGSSTTDVIGQKYPIQSSVLIVFTTKNTSNQVISYWEFNESIAKLSLKKFSNNLPKKMPSILAKKKWFKVLNHGELCPKTCPPGE